MTTGTRPLLLIDVDGVLSLFGFEPPAPAGTVWTEHVTRLESWARGL
jgi:hypothetical protein